MNLVIHDSRGIDLDAITDVVFAHKGYLNLSFVSGTNLVLYKAEAEWWWERLQKEAARHEGARLIEAAETREYRRHLAGKGMLDA